MFHPHRLVATIYLLVGYRDGQKLDKIDGCEAEVTRDPDNGPTSTLLVPLATC